MANSVENYVRSLARLESRISNIERNNQSQAFTSIRNLEIRDDDDNIIGKIGQLDDGSTGLETYAPEEVEPRVLPVPTAPLLEPGVGNIIATWDGQTLENAELPKDFYCLEIHASEEENFEASDLTLVSALYETQGSSALIGPVFTGEWFVRLRLRARNGEVSEASEASSIEVELDLPELNDSIANASGGTNFYSPTPPVPGENGFGPNDIWFDSSIDPDTGLISWMPHRWDQTANNGAGAWISIADERINALQDAQDLLREELDTVVETAGSNNFYKPVAPKPTDATPPKVGDLWFDTSTGGNNTAHYWNGTEWISLEDARLDQLQQAQTDFTTELSEVQQTASAAQQSADDAEASAQSAQETADQAKADAVAKAQAAEKAAKDYAEAQAEAARLAAVASSSQDAEAKAQAAEQAAKKYADAEAEAARLAAIATASGDAKAKADAAQAKAIADAALDAKTKADKAKADAISAASSDATAKADAAKAQAKADAALDAKAKADAAQKAAEAKAAEAKSAADAAKAVADSALSKAEQAHTAAGSAQDAADAAMEAATHNAKNLFSTANPTGTAPKGTIWFKTDSSNRIIGQWQQTGGTETTSGSTWTKRELTNSVIANLDAGKITSGYIDVARLKAGSIDADVVLVPGSAGSTVIRNGAITTEKIATGSITAASGIISEIDASVITVGKLQGSIIAAQTIIGSSAILDGSLTAKSLKAGTITAESGIIGSLDLGKATVGELDGVRIKAGTINTSQLNSTAINGMEIVAAKIYTSKTGARIQLLTTGLSAYSSSNVRTFNIASNTGDVEMIGKLYTGTSGGYRTVLNQESWDNFSEFPIYGGGSSKSPMVGSGLRLGKDGSVTTSAEMFYAEETYYTGTVSKYLRLNGPTISSRRSELAIGTSGIVGGYRNTSNALFLSSISLDKSDVALRHEAPAKGVFSLVDAGEYSDGTPFAFLSTSNSASISDNSSVTVSKSDGIVLRTSVGAEISLNGAGDANFYIKGNHWNAGDATKDTTSAANVYMSGSGWMYKKSSVRASKLMERSVEQDVPDIADRIYQLQPKTWIDKHAAERWAEVENLRNKYGDDFDIEKVGEVPDRLYRIPGLIAEDVRDAGLDILTTQDDSGELTGVAYERLAALMIPAMLKLKNRLDALEAIVSNS